MEERIYGRRKSDRHRHVFFIMTLLLIFGMGFVGFKVGGNSVKNPLTGNTITANYESFNSLPVTKWVVLSDKNFVLKSDKAYMAFGKGIRDISLRYSLSSDKELKIYWMESERDCQRLIDGQDFEDYPSCQPIGDVKVFRSGECTVPESSGICILNENSEPAEISLLLEKKV